GLAGKVELAARVALSIYVELGPAEIAAELDIMAAVIPCAEKTIHTRLVMANGRLTIVQAGNTALRKTQAGRPPIERGLIVARNSGSARYIRNIREKGNRLIRLAAELIAERTEEARRKAPPEADRSPHSTAAVQIEEIELARVIAAGIVHVELGIDRIFPFEALADAEVVGIGVGVGDQRYLVVVRRIPSHIRLRVKLQQSQRLRADAARR